MSEIRKEPMTDLHWHYTHSIESFIKEIELGETTNSNVQMAFFGKNDLMYYDPPIYSLDTNYLREMRDKFGFEYVVVFGGGGIENEYTK